MTIRSADGFVLAGSYFETADRSPGVALFHQCSGTDRQGFTALARSLVAGGISALSVDSRGFGESRDERYRDFRAQMDEIEARFPEDNEATLRWLLDQPKTNRDAIAVLGSSCGCEQAVGLAARRPEIAAVVCVSGSLTESGHEAFQRVLQRPLLVAFSDGDAYGTPVSMGRLFRESRHDFSKALIYKGRIHGVALFEHDASLVGSIVRWLQQVLRK